MELINQIDETLSFNNKNIRVIGTCDEPWFVAKDICNVLEIKDVSMALTKIPEKWKGTKVIGTLGGDQNLRIINESGIYKLIMRSNKPIAEKFQEFVCEEILPSIRKTGEYKMLEILEKNKKLEEEILLKEQNIEEIETKLYKEQLLIIKQQKVLEQHATKVTTRHKFIKQQGLYIIHDPHCKYSFFKFGISEDINKRLSSYRTFTPDIKVDFIFYTDYYELFEKILHIKFADYKLTENHEIILTDKDLIINCLREINRVCGFNAFEELDLWRINLESPPSNLKKKEPRTIQVGVEKKINVPVPKRQKYHPINQPLIFVENKINETTTDNPIQNIEVNKNDIPLTININPDINFIPEKLTTSDYSKKNLEAPEGMRYCNSFCQKYQDMSEFAKISASLSTSCDYCKNMEDLAKLKINNGIYTSRDISLNPTLVFLNRDEKLCYKCGIIKNIAEFQEKRRQCKKCRYSKRNNFKEDFKEIIDKQIELISQAEDKKSKLEIYTKDQIHLIAQKVDVKRKFSDNLNIMREKLFNYFTGQN